MPRITPCLWFDTQAEEAATFYASIFRNSSVGKITRYTDAHYPGGPEAQPGKVLTVDFELDGQKFTSINGGPVFQFSEAVSMVIDCKDQAEVDYYWDALLAGGGQPSQCGWLKDRFGFSWQVTPVELYDLVNDPDPAKARRATEAMLKMVKLDIGELKKAHAG
ncbi:MAG: VOC family protein [Caulobacteraceae bacterium]|nr:VOC family protein [Caulobacteraceae bacterium]